MERVMGIEPTRPAWKAGVLPLNYTRITTMVPRTGLEPVREILPTDFKSVASANSATPAKIMVGKTGFEPATPWSQAKYSTKLSYFPIVY